MSDAPSPFAHSLERALMLYGFPVQLIVGLAGNSLNLIVLNNRRMRSNTNTLLAMVALADVLFLLAMLPHTVQFNHTAMVRHPALRNFVLHFNHHVIAAVNTCAIASAWLVVAVSVERMTAVRWPLRARGFWTRGNLFRVVLAVWAFSLLFASHSHFTMAVRSIPRKPSQNGTAARTVHTVATIRPGLERVWGLLTTLSVCAGVLLPVVLVLLANAVILRTLGRERRFLPSHCSAPGDSPEQQLHSSLRHQRQHRRATLAVLVIAATFTLCQTPSALVHLTEVCWPAVGQSALFRTAAVLSNSLVVTGKTANHFLLCLRSAHFRQSVRLVLGSIFSRSGRRPTLESDRRLILAPPREKGGQHRVHSLVVEWLRTTASRTSVRMDRASGATVRTRLSLPAQIGEARAEADKKGGDAQPAGPPQLLTVGAI